MSQIIYDSKDNYTGLLDLSADNITGLYDLFNYYATEYPTYLSQAEYKVVRTQFIYFLNQSVANQKKYTTYNTERPDIIDSIIEQCYAKFTKWTTNSLMTDKYDQIILDRADSNQINTEFRLADDDNDGYLTFDNFIYAMFCLYPTTVTWTQFLAIIMLDADKLAKCVELFKVFTTSARNLLNVKDYYVIEQILIAIGISGFALTDVTDYALSIYKDYSNLADDRVYYYFYFKNTLLTYYIMNTQDDVYSSMFEYMNTVMPLL